MCFVLLYVHYVLCVRLASRSYVDNKVSSAGSSINVKKATKPVPVSVKISNNRESVLYVGTDITYSNLKKYGINIPNDAELLLKDGAANRHTYTLNGRYKFLTIDGIASSKFVREYERYSTPCNTNGDGVSTTITNPDNYLAIVCNFDRDITTDPDNAKLTSIRMGCMRDESNFAYDKFMTYLASPTAYEESEDDADDGSVYSALRTDEEISDAVKDAVSATKDYISENYRGMSDLDYTYGDGTRTKIATMIDIANMETGKQPLPTVAPIDTSKFLTKSDFSSGIENIVYEDKKNNSDLVVRSGDLDISSKTIHITCINMDDNSKLDINISEKFQYPYPEYVYIRFITIAKEIQKVNSSYPNLDFFLFVPDSVDETGGYVKINPAGKNEVLFAYKEWEFGKTFLVYKNLHYILTTNFAGKKAFTICISCSTDSSDIIIDYFIPRFCWGCDKIFDEVTFFERIVSTCNDGIEENRKCIGKSIRAGKKQIIPLKYGFFIDEREDKKWIDNFKKVELSFLDFSQQRNMNGAFKDLNNIEVFDLSNSDLSNTGDCSSMFKGCTNLHTVKMFNVDLSKCSTVSGLFDNCANLRKIDISFTRLTRVTDFSGMFRGCNSLESIDLSFFEGLQPINMEGMFNMCNSLESIDLSSIDASQITNVGSLFRGCSSLKSIDLSPLSGLRPAYMSSMFEECSSLESIDLSMIDTSSVSVISNVFRDCVSLRFANISGFNFSACDKVSFENFWVEFRYIGDHNIHTVDMSGIIMPTTVPCARLVPVAWKDQVFERAQILFIDDDTFECLVVAYAIKKEKWRKEDESSNKYVRI